MGYPIGRLGRRVVVRAYQETDLAGRSIVGTGHLLLGVVRDEGTTGDHLRGLGVSLEAVRAAVEAGTVPAPRAPGRPVLSGRAVRALAAAGVRADRRRARWVEPQDIVAALISVEGSAAERVLRGIGVDPVALEAGLPPGLDEDHPP